MENCLPLKDDGAKAKIVFVKTRLCHESCD